MRKILYSLLLSCFCLATMAEDAKTHLVVCGKDGTKYKYVLTEMPKVTFAENNLTITANGIEVNYTLKDIASIVYESNPISAITDIETNKQNLKIKDDILIFSDVKANNIISVHSLNGTLLFMEKIHQNGEYTFSLSNLNPGVYMVTINNLTYKIFKK